MTKWIPLWMKCPIALFLNQVGKLPMNIILSNIRWSFTQNRECSIEIKDKAYQKAQRTLCRYLSRRYGDLIDEICWGAHQGTYSDNAPFWVFWWQGIESAPEIIKICVSNMKKNAGNHPVRVIDSQNYHQYIQIPDHVSQKLQQRKISITHFSDFLRMKLLSEHGGMWLDATVFVNDPIREDIFRVPIWTVRNPGLDMTNVSRWEWSINFMGGWQGNVLFKALAQVLDRYWLEHEIVADYFLTDCLVRVVYDRCAVVKTWVDDIKPSNAHFYFYQERFSKPLDELCYENERSSETWAYKVSWKEQYMEQTADGRDTYFGRWKKDFAQL